jgi:hypothetical protein
VGDDLDPAAKPKRRQFSAEYKLGILAERYRITLLEIAPDGGVKERIEGTGSAYVLAICADNLGELRVLTDHDGPARQRRKAIRSLTETHSCDHRPRTLTLHSGRRWNGVLRGRISKTPAARHLWWP